MTDPGALVGLNGDRRKISLAVFPAAAFGEDEPADYHEWSAQLQTSGGVHVQFWTAEQGGQQMTDLFWYGHYEGPWSSSPIPSELWVQGVGTGEVDLTFSCKAIDHYGTAVPYEDTVKFTVMEAQLDVDGLDNADEEDPGAFVGVGGTRKMFVRKPLPAAPLLPTDKVKLSWSPAQNVNVWDDYDKTGPIANGRQFTMEELNEGTGSSVREIWVEGAQASSALRDVTFTLEYLRQGAETEDVVNFTVYERGLKSVTFDGFEQGDFHTVYVDNTGEPYGTPHWEDNSEPLNGNATDEGDHQYPVCYVRGKPVLAAVVFLATPKEAFAGAKIQGAGMLTFAQKAASWHPEGNKWYALAALNSGDGRLIDSVYHYQPFTVTWTLTSDDGRSCSAES